MFDYDKKQWVINPNTGRHIRVGGRQYKNLIKLGIIKQPPKIELKKQEEIEEEKKQKPKYELIDLAKQENNVE